jgi:hypothetical protein
MKHTTVEASQFFECSKRQTEAYDEQDLIDACNDQQANILECLADGDYIGAGLILSRQRQETIDRRINIELYGYAK